MRRIIGLVVLLVVVVGGYLVYNEFFGGNEPKAVSLTSSAPTGGAVDFNGNWTVDRSSGKFSVADQQFTSTWAGYRINEELAGFGANTAVGRTRDVTGEMTISGNKVSSANFQVDMTTLSSDKTMRDNAIGHRGLETSNFPTAKFRLTKPITIADEPRSGENISTQATGSLTLHGVTKQVTIPISARYAGGHVTVVSSFPVKLSDYNMQAPVIPGRVLSVNETGKVELHLLMKKS